jgi:hypothetical protein
MGKYFGKGDDYYGDCNQCGAACFGGDSDDDITEDYEEYLDADGDFTLWSCPQCDYEEQKTERLAEEKAYEEKEKNAEKERIAAAKAKAEAKAKVDEKAEAKTKEDARMKEEAKAKFSKAVVDKASAAAVAVSKGLAVKARSLKLTPTMTTRSTKKKEVKT